MFLTLFFPFNETDKRDSVDNHSIMSVHSDKQFMVVLPFLPNSAFVQRWHLFCCRKIQFAVGKEVVKALKERLKNRFWVLGRLNPQMATRKRHLLQMVMIHRCWYVESLIQILLCCCGCGWIWLARERRPRRGWNVINGITKSRVIHMCSTVPIWNLIEFALGSIFALVPIGIR